MVVAIVKNYIQSKREARQAEFERMMLMEAIGKARQRYLFEQELFRSALEQFSYEHDEEVVELAFASLRHAERQYMKLVEQAKESNIRAYWKDVV